MIDRYFNPLKYLEKSQSLFLFGARGTGKTSLLQDKVLRQDGIYFDLLKGEVFRRYITSPFLMRQEIEHALKKASVFPLIVAIDEVQRIPEILNEVHSLIETHKKKICFILTGSSARKLKRQHANMLAGRAITTMLYPLGNLDTEIDLNLALQWGTLPKVYLNDEFREETLASYVGTYLREEIREEAIVRKIDLFSRFLELAAQMNGEPINFSKLGRSLKSTTNTIQDYFSILCDSWIAHRIDGWSQSVKRQLMQAPKFYLFDCGVLNSITGEIRAELRPGTYRYGRLFETWVIQEMIRYNDYKQLGLKFFYWRDRHGHEIDLVVARSYSKPLLAIEIKSIDNPTADEMAGFSFFAEDYPKIPKIIVCTTPKPYLTGGGIEVLPLVSGLKRIDGL